MFLKINNHKAKPVDSKTTHVRLHATRAAIVFAQNRTPFNCNAPLRTGRATATRQSRHHHLSVHLLDVLLFWEPPSTVFQPRLLRRRQRRQLRPDMRTMDFIVGVESSQTEKAIHQDTRFVHGRPHQARRTKAFHSATRLARCRGGIRTINEIGTKVLTQVASTIRQTDLQNLRRFQSVQSFGRLC